MGGPDTRSIQEPNRPAGTSTTGRERRMPCNSRGPWGPSSDSRGENRGQRHIPRQNASEGGRPQHSLTIFCSASPLRFARRDLYAIAIAI